MIFNDMFATVDDQISVEEFQIKLKTLLGNLITINEIEEFTTSLRKKTESPEEGDTIFLSKQVFKKLKKSAEKERVSHFKEVIKDDVNVKMSALENPDSNSIRKDFRKFIEAFADFCLDTREDTTKQDFVSKVASKIDTYITENQEQEVTRFVVQTKMAFSKPQFRIHWIRMIKLLLLRFDYKPSSNERDEQIEAQSRKLRTLQELLCRSGVAQLCFNLLLETDDLDEVVEIVDVLILLAEKGSRYVQEAMLRNLKANGLGFRVLNLVKEQYSKYIRNHPILAAKKHHNSAILTLSLKFDKNNTNLTLESLQHKITFRFTKLIQLFCDNVFSDFQVRHTIRASY